MDFKRNINIEINALSCKKVIKKATLPWYYIFSAAISGFLTYLFWMIKHASNSKLEEGFSKSKELV